ncbi:hypothetical protein JL720_2998 [Aureococcus anophagefferens]|nr:hypothetical protein JL720_2998 [Aureococcus anophagefferens]
MTADLDRKLACMPDNPKRPQTKSWERYEKYKAATTVGEFLDLGGTLADLAHDTGKGFVQYADKKSHKPPNFPRAAAQKAPLSAEEKAWQTWDDDELDDVCDTCGEYTVTDSGAPMSNVLICDACDCETHLRCSGLLRMPPDDEGYRCVNCVDGTSGGEVDRPAPRATTRTPQRSAAAASTGARPGARRGAGRGAGRGRTAGRAAAAEPAAPPPRAAAFEPAPSSPPRPRPRRRGGAGGGAEGLRARRRWWEKKDPRAAGAATSTSTGACQWEPVAKPPQSPSFH